MADVHITRTRGACAISPGSIRSQARLFALRAACPARDEGRKWISGHSRPL
jgi:hypothetical protein